MLTAGLNGIKVLRIVEVEFIHSVTVNRFGLLVSVLTLSFQGCSDRVYSSHAETILPQTLQYPIKIAP